MCYINRAGATPFMRDSCHVVVDGLVICGPVDFQMAFAVMFAAYFVFNIAYPKDAAATLEFIQRQVLCSCFEH